MTTTNEAMTLEHQFAGPHGWVQWKGTNVCMDVHCECGEMSHIDAEFCYVVQCPCCGRRYWVNGNVEFIEVVEDNSYVARIATWRS